MIPNAEEIPSCSERINGDTDPRFIRINDLAVIELYTLEAMSSDNSRPVHVYMVEHGAS